MGFIPLDTEKLRRRYTEKLDESGLRVAAKKLGFRLLTGQQTARHGDGFDASPGFSIPYYNSQGRPTGFKRVRYLDQRTEGKYAQEPGTGAHVYFPRNTPEPWAKVLDNPTKPLLITEGELKAACGCEHGLMTLGLGGVSSFSAKKDGKLLLDELAQITWIAKENTREPVRRTVYIVYDSDAIIKTQIYREMMRLAETLVDYGADVKTCVPGDLNGEGKTGMDDFIMSQGIEKFVADVLGGAEDFELGNQLWDYNNRYVWITKPGAMVASYDSKATWSEITFKANGQIDKVVVPQSEEELEANNYKPKYKRTSVAAEWCQFRYRKSVDRLTYEPGGEREFLRDREYFLNQWQGLPVEPKRGSVKPWRELLDYVFQDAEDPSHRRWFEWWLAYPLQHLGQKMQNAVIAVGPQGTGKTTIGLTMRALYGENFAKISEEDAFSDFNSWAGGTQFVLVEELGSHSRRIRNSVEHLKGLITEVSVNVNQKYVPVYTIPAHSNFYFTSNRDDALYLERDDRRFFVLRFPRKKLPKSFYAKYYQWLEDEGGAAALLHYFQRLDLGAWTPYEPPPVTEAKREAIDTSKSELEAWLSQLANDSIAILRTAGVPREQAEQCDLWSARQLLTFYGMAEPDAAKRVTTQGMARALSRSEHVRMKLTNVGTGSIVYYAIRKADIWEDSSHAKRIKHLQRFEFRPEKAASKLN